MNNKNKASCKDYKPEGKHGKLQHLLIPYSKWFGFLKGDICILCHQFFPEKLFKFWRKNDN